MVSFTQSRCPYGPLPLLILRYLLLASILILIFFLLMANLRSSSPIDQPLAESNRTTKSLGYANRTRSSHDPLVLRHLMVNTETGQLRGFIQNVSGVEVSTFLSVPYGEPPVGARRFRRTVPIAPWKGVRDATTIPSPCIQSEYTQRLFPVKILNENITEDCLFINIWTPSVKEPKRPVMVLIHGGLFTIGSIGIDEYDGRMLAAYGDVVVVTLQYRLGVFGFLDLDTPEIPGNMGLFDQFTALKWIHNNIHHFGGDPELVTLFGTSAGSISIGFHMFAPNATQLFRRAILQSGSPMLINDVYSRAEQLAEKFAMQVGCYSKTSNNESIYDEPELVVACLDQTPFEQIYEAQGALVKNNPIPFMPTIPSEYIDNFISDYNETHQLPQREVLMGFNLNEGALMLHAAYPEIYTRHTVPQYTRLSQVQNRVVEMGIDSGLKESQANSIAQLLIRGREVDTPVRWAQVVADLFSDIMFICPTYEFANKLATLNVTTHLYLFAQRARNSAWGEWMQVTHHDEITFVMGYPLRYPHQFSKEDREISSKMIKTWANFARTGQIAQKYYPEEWKPYNPVDKFYMQIQANQLRLGNNFHNESCDLYSLLADYMN